MKRSMMNVYLASTLMVFLAACGAKPQSSSAKIINGLTANSSEYPSVVHLYDIENNGSCTGTFINSTTVLTAAHCTEYNSADSRGNVSGSISIIQITDFTTKKYDVLATSTSIVRNPLWDEEGGSVNKYDLALITFPEGTAKALSTLASAQPDVGDQVVLVGLGLDQNIDRDDTSSNGVKRIGTNEIEAVSDGFLAFENLDETTNDKGKFSGPGPGDSGGPLFVDGHIAGIVSGAQADLFSNILSSYYIDINSKASKKFLDKHLKNPDFF